MSLAGRFQEDGFAVARGVFSPSEVVELESEFDRIVAQISSAQEETNARWSGPEMDRMGAENTVVLHTHNVQRYSAAWMRALIHPGFLAAAGEILGPDIILHHSKLFQKPAENGAPFPMHQDWEYFPSEKDTMAAAIIHVSRADDQMGCLRVYPGSHRLGRVRESQGQAETFLRDYPIEGATPLEAEAGDVVFFHYFTVHGSLPNRSKDVRKTVLVQMHSGQDRMEPAAHPYEGICLAGWNHAATRATVNDAKA
jgi:ectoine hydroxylase-related dioxygenase (phytanoyl-CoA dioxygenase family)